MMLRTSAALLAGGGGADVLVMGVKMLHESAAAPAAASASRTDVVGKEPPGREYLQDLEDEFVAGAVDPPSTSAKMTVGTRTATAPSSAKKKIVRSSVTTPTATSSAASDGAEAGGSEKQAGARSVDHGLRLDDDVATGRATPTRSFIDEENQFDDVDDDDNLHVHSAGEEVSDSELVAVRPEASSTRAGATPSGSVVSRAATAPEQPAAVGGHAEAGVVMEGVDSPSGSLTANASSSTPAPGFAAPSSTTSTHGTSTTGVVRVEKSRKRPAWLNSVASGTGTPAASTTTDTGSTDMKTVRRESVVADAAPPPEEEDVSDFIVEFGGQDSGSAASGTPTPLTAGGIVKDPVPPEIQLQSTLDRLVRKQKQHVLAEGQQDQESSLSSTESGKGGIAKGRSENVDGMFALAEFDEAPKEQKAHRSPTETLPVIPPAESASSSLWLFAACGFIVSLLLLVRDQNYVRMRDHVANRVEAAACAWSLRSTSRSSDCISQWPIARTLCPGAGDAGDDDDDVDDEHEDVEDFESSTSAGGMVVRTTSSGNKSQKTSGVRARSLGKKKKTSAAWQAQGQQQETISSVERTHQAKPKGTPGAAEACRNSTKPSDQSKTSSLITNMLPPILQRWNRSRSSRKTSTSDQPGHFEHSEGGARHNFPPDDEQQKLLFRLRNVDVVAASLLRDSVEQQSYDCLLSAPLAAEAGGRVCRVEGRIVLVGGPQGQGQGEHGDDDDARNVGRKTDETPASIPSPFTDTKCVFWEASVREEGSERTLGFDVGAARTLAVGRKAAGKMGIQLDDAAGTIINLSQSEAISLVLQSRFLERVAATEDINLSVHRPAFQPAVRQRSSPRRRAAEQGSRVAKATAFVAQYGSATDYGSTNVDDASTLDLEQREFDHEEQLHGCSSLMYDEVSLHDSFESTSPSALASGSTSRSGQSCNAALLLKESCLHEGMRVTAVGEVRLLENGQLGLFGETMSTNLNGSSTTRRSPSTVDAEGGFTSWENRACFQFQNTTSNNGGAVGGCTVTSQIIVSDIGVGNSRDADVAGRDGGDDEDEPRPWLFPWRLAHTPHSTRGAGKAN